MRSVSSPRPVSTITGVLSSPLPTSAEHVEPGHGRQAQVEHDELGRQRRDLRERDVTVAGFVDGKAFSLECAANHAAQVDVVVYDEDHAVPRSTSAGVWSR